MNESASIKKLLQALAVMAVIVAMAPILYFHYHSSEASTLRVLSGAIKLQDQKLRFVEIEHGIYMFRSRDVQWGTNGVGAAIYPCNPYLASLGWTFQDQMGAMLTYQREGSLLEVSHRSCGSNYTLALLHQDPTTGQSVVRTLPFNLFR